MRIAIVGAGLSGLGAGFFLKERGHHLTFFDKKGIGGGASGVASGLLHPYPGKSGLPSKYADLAMPLSIRLIDIAEEALSEKVAMRNGIVKGGKIIESGMTVYMDRYLAGLWRTLESALICREVDEKEEFADFDCVVFALGGGFRNVSHNLPIQFVKGQILTVESHQYWERSEIGNGHISPIASGKYQIGSTYEHHFSSDEPNQEETIRYLGPRVESFLPPLGSFRITDCKAGIRVARKGGYLPFVERVHQKRFFYTGLGSRGLLYHAFYGRHLVSMIESHFI